MSADDTTIVIAAYRLPSDSELSYTAAVVQAVENLFDGECALKKAKAIFVDVHREWCHGKGSLGRAKAFAHLLAQDMRENGILEHENQPIIEIAEDGVYELSDKGRRKTPPVAAMRFGLSAC